jgi:FkbM family methyltransferase
MSDLLNQLHLLLFQEKQRKTLMGFDNDSPVENGEFGFIESVRDKIDLYIDAGAKIGDFLRLFNCKKIGFEPDERNKARLEKIKNCKMHYIGLGNEDAIIKANMFDKDSDRDTDYFIHRNISLEDPLKSKAYYKEKEIQIKKLDSFKIKTNNIFLKIDTDGMEYDILKGAENLIDNTNNMIISFEYSWYLRANGHSFKDIYTYLRNKKFILFRITPAGLMRQDEYYKSHDDIEFCNYVAIKNFHPSNKHYRFYDVIGINQNQFFLYEDIKKECQWT